MAHSMTPRLSGPLETRSPTLMRRSPGPASAAASRSRSSSRQPWTSPMTIARLVATAALPGHEPRLTQALEVALVRGQKLVAHGQRGRRDRLEVLLKVPLQPLRRRAVAKGEPVAPAELGAHGVGHVGLLVDAEHLLD